MKFGNNFNLSISADSKLLKMNTLNSDLLEVKFPRIPLQNSLSTLEKKY